MWIKSQWTCFSKRHPRAEEDKLCPGILTDPNSTPLCCFIRCGTSYTCLPLCLVRKCLGENSSQENRKDPPSRSCLFGLIDKADVAIETCPSTPRVLHKEFRGLLMSILKAVCSSLASGQIPCCVDIFWEKEKCLESKWHCIHSSACDPDTHPSPRSNM